MRRPIALTIAGSDSGGGAGIQADLKTFHHFGVYGTSVVTLVTAQNTRRVARVEPLPADLVAAQIDAVAEDLRPAAVKTGALGSAACVDAVADGIERHALDPVVVDPVAVSTQGDRLLSEDGLAALRSRLVPLASLLTPNRPEAEALLGSEIPDERSAERAARALREAGARAVLLKGGHAGGRSSDDLLCTGDALTWLRAPRIDTPHTHGSGCSYAAAITARLARGDPLEAAVRTAKGWISRAIASAPGLGAGHGPLDHWAPLEDDR